MKPAAFRKLSTSVAHRNPWFTVRVDEVERPGGLRGPFYWIEMKPGATVLPMTAGGDVYLIREYKYPLDSISLEAVSGGVEPDESPRACAERELREEAGFEAAEWADLGRIDPLTTSMRGPNYLFVATGLRPIGEALEEGEQVEVVRLPFADALERVLDGAIVHGTTCALILKASELLRRGGLFPAR